MNIINHTFFVLALLAFVSCSCKNTVTVTVSNTENFGREAEMVGIPVEELAKIPPGENTTYIVKDEQGREIPSQVTHDGLLIFQSGLKAGDGKRFTISPGTPQEYEAKVFGRLYPERRDDFSWENDRIGFRFYGDRLKKKDGPNNALDLWLKRTDKMVLDKWYHDLKVNKISYHKDHGEGCDPYNVGRTLGAGNIAPFVDGTLYLNENFLSAEVLDEGPLRITFRLTYPDMDVNGETVSERKTISLDAGSQLTRIVQEFGFAGPAEVAAGITKREEESPAVLSDDSRYFVYAEPRSEEYDNLYVGVLIPQGIRETFVHEYEYTNPVKNTTAKYANLLATTGYTPGQPLTYYTGFGWSKYGFEDLQQFVTYMDRFSAALESPFVISYK